jgi:hypothetical protein
MTLIAPLIETFLFETLSRHEASASTHATLMLTVSSSSSCSLRKDSKSPHRR